MLLEELFLEIAGANLLRSRPEREKKSDKPEYQTLSAASSHVKNIQDIQRGLDSINKELERNEGPGSDIPDEYKPIGDPTRAEIGRAHV